MNKMNSKPFIYNEPLPSKEEGEARAFMDYVKNGDAFFAEGLTFDEFHEQKRRIMRWMDKSSRKDAFFYTIRSTEFDGYHDA